MGRRSHPYPEWLKAWKRSGSPTWPKQAVIVMLHWTDAAYSEDEPGTVNAHLIGFLTQADEKHIALGMEAFEDGDTRTHITVPAGMVNAIVTLGTLKRSS